MLALLPLAVIAFPVLVAPAAAFEPTYDFQIVQAGQSLPSGLDVKLTLHDPHDGTENASAMAAASSSKTAAAPRLARIPPTWRLQVWTGDSFARADVGRFDKISVIEERLTKDHESHRHHRHSSDSSPGGQQRCTVALYRAEEMMQRLDGDASAEAASLFTLQLSRDRLAAKLECEPAV